MSRIHKGEVATGSEHPNSSLRRENSTISQYFILLTNRGDILTEVASLLEVSIIATGGHHRENLQILANH